MTSRENVETLLNKCLLANIRISSETKTLKEGKLLLFSVKDFFCVFTLISLASPTKKFIYELPYPFDIADNDGKIVLDYTVKTFCLYNKNAENLLTKIKPQKASKYYNKRLYIQRIPL
jgi:hypothetical protein